MLPPQAYEKMVTELHNGHPGIVKMKNLARVYMWRLEIDTALEDPVKQCVACQNSRKMPPRGPLHPWKWLDKPWSRLHIAGPLMRQMLLVIIDAHSKWLEVYITNSSTSLVTIKKLRNVFS